MASVRFFASKRRGSGTEGSDDPNNSTVSSSGFARISLQQLQATERERLMEEQRSAAAPPAGGGRRSDVDDEERSELDEADEESPVESAEEVDEDKPHAAKAATTATARRNFNEWRAQHANTHHRLRQKYASESVALEGDDNMRQRPAAATLRRHDSEATRGSGSAPRHQPPLQQQQRNGSQRSRSSSSKPQPHHPARRNPAVEVTMHPTCKVIQDDKMLVLEATMPTLDTVTVETPLFRNGFSLEALTQFAQDVMMRYRKLPFWRYRLYAVGALLALFFILPGFLSGLLWGCYLSTIVFLYVCVSDPLPLNQVDPAVSDVLMERIQKESAKHEMSRTVYKGWMNIFNDRYSPHTFHVNGVQTVLVRLDGNLLRISRPERAMLKHAFHADPTLTEPEPRMLAQTIYDLTNAQIKLRPRRLARRRWYVRKYPICIKLASPGDEIRKRRDSALLKLVDRARRRKSPSESDRISLDRVSNGSGIEINEDNPLAVDDRTGLSSLSERHTVVELGREPKGYLSDESSDEAEESATMISRSASDANLSNATGVVSRFSKYFPGPRQRARRTIYLFTRSAREKERWFHLFRKACHRYTTEPETTSEEHGDGEPIKRRYSVPFNPTRPVKLNRDYFLYLLHSVQFSKHLDEILPDRPQEVPEVGGIVNVDLGRLKWEPPKDVSSNELVVVANLLASRVFYDFCRDAYWCNAVKQKIQSKLATLHLPYFIETLELSGFDIGTAIPKIRKIYAPVVDEWGLWIDFEMHYEGCIKLTLETRVNLMKLKEQNDSSVDLSAAAAVASSLPSSLSAMRVSRLSDDEAEISPETSPDEDFGSKIKLSNNGHTKKKKTGEKLLSLVDKIAQSNFFREASELRPIRKMLEEISSTRLILNVEVTALEGPATINLPPPPSDRLWYGFRKPPTRMSVRAVPQVGDRSVIFSTLSEWIESKLVLLFEKNLVMPNLDDIVVPVMCGNELLQGSINR